MSANQVASKALEATDAEDPKKAAQVLNELEEGAKTDSDALVLQYLSEWSEENDYKGLSEWADTIAADSPNFSFSKSDFLLYGSALAAANLAAFEGLDYIMQSEPVLSSPDFLLSGIFGVANGFVYSIHSEDYANTEELLASIDEHQDYFPEQESVAEVKDRLRFHYSRDI